MSITVIGISGKKGAGKTTVGEEVARILGAARVDLADEIKEICARHFSATTEQLYGTESQKNERLPCGLTARQVMQRVGKAFREIDPNAWLRPFMQEVRENREELDDVPVVVCDVRYPNEVDAIRNMGGVVIRLTRAPFADSHETECALDGYEGFDYVLDNDGMTVEATVKAVLTWLEERGLPALEMDELKELD